VERTLLSAAFDFAFDFDFDLAGVPHFSRPLREVGFHDANSLGILTPDDSRITLEEAYYGRQSSPSPGKKQRGVLICQKEEGRMSASQEPPESGASAAPR
jgi:hypothetical protein